MIFLEIYFGSSLSDRTLILLQERFALKQLKCSFDVDLIVLSESYIKIVLLFSQPKIVQSYAATELLGAVKLFQIKSKYNQQKRLVVVNH